MENFYPSILPQPVAKLPEQSIFFGIYWRDHILIIEKIKDLTVRFWYIGEKVSSL